jgi:phage shock protein C
MKRLALSIDRKFLGVCGGIGEYLEMDPAVIRILWVIGTFASFGMGILIYFVCFVIMSSPR